MQYKMFKFISWVLCLLPHAVVLWFGSQLGKLYYQIAAKQRLRAIKQMKESLKISDQEAQGLAKESFVNIGRNFLEVMYMPRLNKENFLEYMEIDHIERMHEALAEGRGVVILTAHVGNWEWLSAALTFSNLPVTAIIKPQPNEQHTKILNEYREMVGVEIFSRGTSELMGATRALKKGKCLGFLVDQDGGPGGVFIDFLGKTASTPMGAAVFSKKFLAPVVPAFILRRPDGRHRVVIGEIMHFEDHGDTDKDLYDFTVKMTKIVEDIIRENPTQWIWFQKRWNTPPEEQKKKHHTVKTQVVNHE